MRTDVVCQGMLYVDLASHEHDVRALRDDVLRLHGIINYKMTADIDATWEVRNCRGELVSPDVQLQHVMGWPLYLNPRAGWGG